MATVYKMSDELPYAICPRCGSKCYASTHALAVISLDVHSAKTHGDGSRPVTRLHGHIAKKEVVRNLQAKTCPLCGDDILHSDKFHKTLVRHFEQEHGDFLSNIDYSKADEMEKNTRLLISGLRAWHNLYRYPITELE